MEAITRLVVDSLARHGLDRPVDPRRLQWSRWSRCDSPHSLLVVPSKPGIFALAEEIMDLASGGIASVGTALGNGHVGTAASAVHAERSSAASAGSKAPVWDGAALQRCDSYSTSNPALAAEVKARRMLAVLQFSEDDDMAFVLDRMFTRVNPMRARLASGLCFLRFVVIEDQEQRRSICGALNQWLLASAAKASGLSADFSSSLELPVTDAASTNDSIGGTFLSAKPDAFEVLKQPESPPSITNLPIGFGRGMAPHLDSGAARNPGCPPLPSGF